MSDSQEQQSDNGGSLFSALRDPRSWPTFLFYAGIVIFCLIGVSQYSYNHFLHQRDIHKIFDADAVTANRRLNITCQYIGNFVEDTSKSVECEVQVTHAFGDYQGSTSSLSIDSLHAFVEPNKTDLDLSHPGKAKVEVQVKFFENGSQDLILRVPDYSTIATTQVTVSPSFLSEGASLAPYWFGFLLVVVAPTSFYINHRIEAVRRTEANEAINEAQTRAEAAPERAKFAWDLARVKLEDYFDRNLAQVNQIFWVATVVMLIGFALIAWGIGIALYNQKTTPAVVAAISGIISEFIGVTFMVIYRSTMEQANQFMAVLERINTVGMAVQVLDSIPEQAVDLKNSTRAQIVSLLLNSRTHITPEK